ncbi:hypothetical protein Tco_0863797 [Tanacetum coccineum]
MEISIADQIALDDALVAPTDRLKIGKCNLRLSSDVTSKEATLQVAYDVLKLTPFYKAFQVSADVPEIYMQEFWATAYVHNRSVRFKMNNKKHILNLDQFRDILQICPKVGNKKFEEPPLEKEILAFLASLGHSGEIRKITDSSSFSSSNLVGRVKQSRGHPNSESYKEYYVIASGKIPPKIKASKKKVDSDAPTKQKSPTVPKEKKGKEELEKESRRQRLETNLRRL